jgi:hypothetical protein
MKKVLIWLFGILIGLAAVAVLAGGAILVINRWHNGGFLTGERVFTTRSYRQEMPFRNAPQPGSPLNPAPQYRMPMMQPDSGFSLARLSFFNPFRLIFLCLVCVGFLVLIVLGIVYLVSPKKRAPVETTPPAQTIAPTAAPVVSQPADEAAHTCSHCGRTVQEDWSHCPYCGASLTGL